MELKQLFSTQDNELEIITDSFKINKNIIELNSRIIQVCNIESISMVEPKKKGITIGVFIGFIIGLALLSYQSFGRNHCHWFKCILYLLYCSRE